MQRDTERTGLCCCIHNFIVYEAYASHDYLKLKHNTIIGISKNIISISVVWVQFKDILTYKNEVTKQTCEVKCI